ncbi:hypothetical protein [Winogradskyella sp. Asnod2-B02-A]
MKALQDLRNRLLSFKPTALKNEQKHEDTNTKRVLKRYFSNDEDDILFI